MARHRRWVGGGGGRCVLDVKLGVLEVLCRGVLGSLHLFLVKINV